MLLVAAAACGSSPLRGGDGGAGSGGHTGGGSAGIEGNAGGAGSGTAGNEGRAGTDGGAGAGTDGPSLTDSRANSAMQADGRCVAYAFKRDGLCSCQTNLPDVCEDGCTDLLVDDRNCGACGHACDPTATCAAGVCGAAPQTVGTTPPGCVALDLAADGDVLYWADAGHGTIMRLAPGGTPAPIATGEDGPRMIAVRGAAVFWVAGARKQVRLGTLGQPAVTVTTSATDIHGLTVSADGATVYYSTGADVMRVAAAGGPALVVAHDARGGLTTALSLDGDHLAFVSDLTEYVDVVTLVEGQVAICGQIVNDALVDVSCKNLSRGPPKLHEQIASPPGWVVWASQYSLVRGESDLAAPRASTTTIGGGQTDLTGLAATSTHGYFAEVGFPEGEGVIYRVPFLRAEGTFPQDRLARAQNAPRSLAIGGNRLYWSTADCAIRAVDL